VRPRLVIVGGAPGTGKTTLARELAARLALPLIAKDDVKEAIADALGTGDVARSRELGAAAFEVMRAVARRSLAGGASVMLESNFHIERSAKLLRELVGMSEARIVVCRTSDTARRERFAGRAAGGGRHPVHLDAFVLESQWEDASFFDLDLGVPTLAVDTTATYAPDLDAIVAFLLN
jgi:predicted kinase